MRSTARILMALSFAAVGLLHFTHPASFVAIMPPYVPEVLHLPAVYLSGVAEVAGGLGLLVPQLRRAAGWGLLLLLVAVFPANIHMAMNGVGLPGMPVNQTLLWARLPLQFVMAALVWWVAELGTARGTKRES
ncbi:MAG: DoxX family protein [Deltaproteobacteria bacterium]|nr:DoxX family protein [Deltaproteobacteria bacterium]